MLNQFQTDAIVAGLRTLFHKPIFDKLLLDDLFNIANIYPDTELHAVIRAMHTVPYTEMKRRFRIALMEKICDAFDNEIVDLSRIDDLGEPKGVVIDATKQLGLKKKLRWTIHK